ncbi:C-type lectin 10, partial [Operophtera brumata]
YVYDKGSESCYKFHRQAQAWSKAYATCKAEGAYLAIINSQLESVVLKDLFAKNPTNTLNGSTDHHTAFSFVGIRDWLDGGSWRTVKGQSLVDAGFIGWASGEPNNVHGGIEHCVSITRAGTYNDISCDYLLSFICEKEPEVHEVTYFHTLLRGYVF